MTKEKKRRSLVSSILRLSVIPVLVLGIILTVYSQNSVREGMSFEVEKSLSGIAHNLISMYNIMDAGEFSYEDGKIMKGETDLTSDYRLLDDVKNDTGADVSIFYGTERRLTTLVDDKGVRMVGTPVSGEVAEIVLGQGEEYFSEHVDVMGAEYFGYYVPIRNDADEVVGISFAGQSVENVNISMEFMIQGNLIICIFVILLAGFICHMSAQGIVSAMQHIKNFLGRLANGNFSQNMNEMVLKRRDELADMGEYAETVSRSLDDLVSRDPLTGLYNRRACKIQADNRNEAEVFTIALGDIDFFKKVNDTYGHDMGDEVLRVVAKGLEKGVSSHGFVARWGGEEFLVGVDTTVEKTEELLRKTVAEIKEHEFVHEDATFHVSITFGIAAHKKGADFEETVGRADELLYQGKENGRDQIVVEK